ncbi:MAG: diguanylate cyclase [Actinomycetia bacterium]|nr:diguanylate cyclase [Actinomycetes bacterium]
MRKENNSISYYKFAKIVSLSSLIFLLITSNAFYLFNSTHAALAVILLLPIIITSLYYFELFGSAAGLLSFILFFLISGNFGDIIYYSPLLSNVIMFLVFISAGYGMGSLSKWINQNQFQLEQHRLAHTITALYTREYLANLINRAINEYERYESCFSIILLEIVNEALKPVNFLKRENLLVESGSRLRRIIRSIDEIGRYNNQYLIVLPHTPMLGAKVVEKRVKIILDQLLREAGVNFTEIDEILNIVELSYPENKEGLEKLLATLQKPLSVS